MQITLDITSLAAGFILGGLVVLLLMVLRRQNHIETTQQEEPDLIREIYLLGRWLFVAYNILKNMGNPFKGKGDEKDGETDEQYESVLRHLLDNRLIIRVEGPEGEEYKLTTDGEDLCRFLDQVSEKTGCRIDG